ncbi:phage baseplate assembly protein domain-containing protein [Paraburkholderia sp.]|jgi:phage gp45-like|uniref:phage baseplate assembly protein domain-containing protein n=1 Tax=Paraburkholderia sp. TaxID=1926495 RepID=UPI0039C9D433
MLGNSGPLERERLTRIDDSGPAELVQVQLSQQQTLGGTPRLIEYGSQPNPHEGGNTVAVFVSGTARILS